VDVQYVSRRRCHRMHRDLLAVQGDIRLQPEVPLLALPGLVLRLVALFLLVLG
jgi:hypothetical protein